MMIRALLSLLRKSAAVAGVLVGITIAHPLVQAAPAPEPSAEDPAAAAQDAAKAFERARSLWEVRDCAQALPLFEQALEASGSPNARLYVARCLRELGHTVEAYEQMERTVRDAMALATTEPRYVPTRDTAAAELALLQQRVGRVIVVLAESLKQARVLVNGREVPPEQLDKPIVVTPGTITVVAVPEGGDQVQRVLTVTAGAVSSVTLQPSRGAEPPSSRPAPVEPQADGGGFGVLRAVGIGVAAVGVAGFVVFAIGRVQRDNEIATLEEDCGPGPCTDPAYADVVDRGKQAETMAGIGLAVGIVGVMAGTAMILFGGEADSAQAGWSPAPSGLRLRF